MPDCMLLFKAKEFYPKYNSDVDKLQTLLLLTNIFFGFLRDFHDALIHNLSLVLTSVLIIIDYFTA